MIWVILGFVALTVHFAAHELAHAYFAQKFGVEVEKAGIGLPIKWMSITINWKRLPFPVTLSPLFLLAYVKVSDEGKEYMDNDMPAEQRSIVAMAGVVVNAAMSLPFIPFVYMLFAQAGLDVPLWISFMLIGTAIGGLVGLIGLRDPSDMRGLKFASDHIFPAIGMGVIALIIWKLLPGFSADPVYAVTHGAAVEGSNAPLGGPVMITKMLLVAKTPVWMLAMSAIIANGLALFNAIPLLPFDGGHGFASALQRGLKLSKREGKVLRFASGTLGHALIALILIGEVTLNLL